MTQTTASTSTLLRSGFQMATTMDMATPVFLLDNAVNPMVMWPTMTIATIPPAQRVQAPLKAAMALTTTATTALMKPMPAAVQHITTTVTVTDTETAQTRNACALHLATLMSPTQVIAMTPMGMLAPDKAHGSAITVETQALTMIVTSMQPRPNDTTVQGAVVDGLAAPPTMVGTVATLRVVVQVHGSQGVQPIGSVVIKTHKIEPKSAADEDKIHNHSWHIADTHL